jgi:hypothetical protein
MTGCSFNGSTSAMYRILLTLALTCCLHAEVLAQWQPIGGPFGGSVVSLATDSRYVYLGTTLGHVWRHPVSGLVTEIATPAASDHGVPGMSLASYPNPCNASTVFTFSLPRASQVTLVLYDILGRNVLTVLDRRFDGGSYQVPLQMRSLSSGMYIAVLNAEGVRAVNRLVLIR